MLKPIATICLLLTTQSFAETGLKKVSYENETADQNSPNNPEKSEATLSPEQLEKIKLEIEQIKAKQIESQQALDELDKEE